MTDTNHIPSIALGYVNAGRKAAMATVISTWGSAPRPVGAQMAVAGDGAFEGSVSGGCVESAVVFAAMDAIEDGACRILEFGVADEDAFSAGLACGGDIRILVEPIDVGTGPSVDLITALHDAHVARTPAGYRVNLETWKREFVQGQGEESNLSGDTFFLSCLPAKQIFVIGAVHIAQALTKMARVLGYRVILIDPRESFGSKERFPDDDIHIDYPDKVMNDIGVDAQSAVITLAHDPKIDLPALEIALKSPAFYIGSLGSTRTHAKRVRMLQDAGYTDTQIARIHGPVGADIGAKTPAEIAVSILAELTERVRRPESVR